MPAETDESVNPASSRMVAGAGSLVNKTSEKGQVRMIQRFKINIPDGCKQIEIAFDDLDGPRVAPRRVTRAQEPAPAATPRPGFGMDHPYGYDGDE